MGTSADKYRKALLLYVPMILVVVVLVSYLRIGIRQTSMNSSRSRPHFWSLEKKEAREFSISSTNTVATSSQADSNNNFNSSVQPTYVMTLELIGQQGSGALSLSTLQCFLSSLYENFYVVEPRLVGSRLLSYTVPSKPSWLTFGSLFDLDAFNSESRKIGYAEMIRLKEFQSTSYKYVIFVVNGPVNRVIWSAHQTDTGVKCFDGKDIFDLEENFRLHMKKANRRLPPGSCIVRVIQLFTNGAFLHRELILNNIFGKWPPGDVVLIFASWAKWFVPVYRPLNGVNCQMKFKADHSYTKAQFHPSARLIRDAQRYEKQFLGSLNRLAIMLRVERVVTQYLRESHDPQSNQPKTIKECFAKVFALKSELGSKYNTTTPLVTLDIGGRFGSKSFRNHTSIKDLSARTLEELYNKKWTMEEWENSFVEAAGGETHPGYIAALQRLLASRADSLVLMGGGNFQAIAVNDYLMSHNPGSTCIHLVCCMSRYDELQRTMMAFSHA